MPIPTKDELYELFPKPNPVKYEERIAEEMRAAAKKGKIYLDTHIEESIYGFFTFKDKLENLGYNVTINKIRDDRNPYKSRYEIRIWW